MNRIDRLLGMILALQGSRFVTAGGLAERFEVSRRTVYRDLQALAEVEETARRVCLTSWPHRAAPLDDALPLLVRQALRERRRLAFTYHSRSTSNTAERRADPYSLVYFAGDWHLLGYCHHREAVRQFRLSRMSDPRLLDERFSMPAESDARRFWANGQVSRTGDCVARVCFAPTVTRWVRERLHYSREAEIETPEGLEVTFRVDRWEELLPWLLGWGGDAVVLSPPELRHRVAEEARRMLANSSEY